MASPTPRTTSRPPRPRSSCTTGSTRYDATLTPGPEPGHRAGRRSREDGKIWTVKLKQGVKFHDGTDLTAADVVQTYEIAQSTNCRYNPSICLAPSSRRSRPSTTTPSSSRSSTPNATWATVYLPAILHREQGRRRRRPTTATSADDQAVTAGRGPGVPSTRSRPRRPPRPARPARTATPTVNYDAVRRRVRGPADQGRPGAARQGALHGEDGTVDVGRLRDRARRPASTAILATSRRRAHRRARGGLPVPRHPDEPGRPRHRPVQVRRVQVGRVDLATRPSPTTTAAPRRSRSSSSRSSRTTSPVARPSRPARSTGSTRSKAPTYLADQGQPGPPVRRVPGLRLLRPVLQPAPGHGLPVRST